jgi:hypothetical protein
LFRNIHKICQIVQRKQPTGSLPYKIDDIRDAITQITNVDQIRFIEYHDKDNPVVGRYKRYEVQLGVYEDFSTRVDIQYSSELNYCKKRYVMCKEMCHTFIDDVTTRVSTPDQITKLIDHLILPEISREVISAFGPFTTENLAKIAAVELLCPIDDRKRVLKLRKEKDISDSKIAIEFRVPTEIIKVAFDPKYVQFMDSMLEEFS